MWTILYLMLNVWYFSMTHCWCKRTIRIQRRNYNSSSLDVKSSTLVQDAEKDTFFQDYQQINKIQYFIENLTKKKLGIIDVLPIGKTQEGRHLKVIKIGSKSLKSKPAIWIDGGIHAREWISPSSVLFILTKLIQNYKKQKDLLGYFDWYVLPVVNPDGYEYSHTCDREWRKNRNPENKMCPGVDLNRNWGYHWRAFGDNKNACSEIYAGKKAFSEPETKAISNFILRQQKHQKFIAFLTFHSFGQVLFTPWGWTKRLPKDYKDMKAVAKKAVSAIFKSSGKKYKISPSSKRCGTSWGGSDDWAYGAAGIKYTYTIELQDTGEYGFRLPKSKILEVAKEAWEAVKALAKEITKKMRKNILGRKRSRKFRKN